MSEITKAKVLEVFTRIFNELPGEDERRRALGAYNLALHELAPWSKSMTAEQQKRVDVVVVHLMEIMKEDHGIEMRLGRKYTEKEADAAKEGGIAAKKFWTEQRDRVPPRPVARDGVEDDDDYREWIRIAKGLAFEQVPTDRAGDAEWTKGFMSGFVGDIWRLLQGLEGIDDMTPEPS